MEESYLFLSQEWVHEVARVVQSARSSDANFKKLTQGFSLSLLYLITDLPQRLRELHNGTQLAILVQVDKGTVRKLVVGIDIPDDKVDFTITSKYDLAKRIFAGEVNAATAFIDREIKVDPMRRVYQRPRFTARAITTGNLLLKIARRVPTLYPSDNGVVKDGEAVPVPARATL